jgi:methionyl-tRNA formyltransferase
MMRVLFFGMDGSFSRAPLDALLGAGIEVCAVLLPARRGAPFAVRRLDPPPPAGPIPLFAPAEQQGIASRAWQRGLPLFELAQEAAPEPLALLASLAPEAACVACWPRRIPPALLELPPRGFLNLHPSLLPAYRGPEPLFWTLRDGARAGVTVHFMDAALDTGDIAAQAPLELPDGIPLAEAERRCAAAGAALLVETLARLEAGTLERQPQPPGGSYAGAPSAADFALDASWPARRAFNFMRGADEWGQPFTLAAGDETLRLRAALSYDPIATLDAPFERAGHTVRARFSPGVLITEALNT